MPCNVVINNFLQISFYRKLNYLYQFIFVYPQISIIFTFPHVFIICFHILLNYVISEHLRMTAFNIDLHKKLIWLIINASEHLTTTRLLTETLFDLLRHCRHSIRHNLKFYQALHADIQPRTKWRKNVFTIEIRSLHMQRMRIKKEGKIQSWDSHNAHESSVPYQCQWDRWCVQARCQMVKRELVTDQWSSLFFP